MSEDLIIKKTPHIIVKKLSEAGLIKTITPLQNNEDTGFCASVYWAIEAPLLFISTLTKKKKTESFRRCITYKERRKPSSLKCAQAKRRYQTGFYAVLLTCCRFLFLTFFFFFDEIVKWSDATIKSCLWFCAWGRSFMFVNIRHELACR